VVNRPKTRAVFKDKSSDVDVFKRISFMKLNYIENFSNYNPKQAQDGLATVLSEMIDLLEKYHSDIDIRNTYYLDKSDPNNPEGVKYSMYEFKIAVDRTLNKVVLKRIYELAFKEYNLFARNMGDAIPTYQKNFRKTVFVRLYKLITEAKYDEFKDSYFKILPSLNLKDSKLNWISYCLERGYQYDKDWNIGGFGEARSSKSAFFCILTEKIYQFKMGMTHDQVDDYLISSKYLDNYYIYKDKKVDYTKVFGTPLWYDEGHFVADRRRSMSGKSVAFTTEKDTMANSDAISYILIQNYSDLDQRIVNKCKLIFQFLKRGKVNFYSDPTSFAIFKSRPFKKFEEKPELLNSYNRGSYRLANSSYFVSKIRFKKPTCKFWLSYKNFKREAQ
jgi:hypothetical protein